MPSYSMEEIFPQFFDKTSDFRISDKISNPQLDPDFDFDFSIGEKFVIFGGIVSVICLFTWLAIIMTWRFE